MRNSKKQSRPLKSESESASESPHPSPLTLARSGAIESIDWENLTESDILQESDEGYTLLHFAARAGYWEKIPKKFQDPKYWKESKTGTTVLISAYQGCRQEWIDKKSLTTKDILKQNNKGDSVSILAAKTGIFFTLPKNIITLEVLQQEISHEDYDTVFHRLAKSNQLSVVDKKFLTEKNLSAKGNYGETIYHILAAENIAHHIPKELWTRSTITLQADNGCTPLHDICQYDHSLIPKDITIEDLLIPTNTEITPLSCWASSENWHKIPDKFLTKNTLETKTKYEASPIEKIIQQMESNNAMFCNQKIQSKFKRTLSKISDDFLKNLSNDRKLRKEVDIPPYQIPNSKEITHLLRKELTKRKALKELKEQERQEGKEDIFI